MKSFFRKLWKKSKTAEHNKLGEGWEENREAVTEGVTFYLKYLGSTLLEELPLGESYGEGVSARAVQRIVNMAKTMGTKLEKVSLKVTPNGIRVVSMEDKQVKIDVTIYRVSFCTADKNHEKLFAFIARNSINETMECHAFYCAKHKIAQAVTLSVSQAFLLARDLWENNKNKKYTTMPPKSCASAAQLNALDKSPMSSPIHTLHTVQSAPQMPTIDLISDTHPRLPKPDSIKPVNRQSDSPQHRQGWQTFDESPSSTSHTPVKFFNEGSTDDIDNADDWFSQLAENRIRSNPPAPSQPFSSFSTDLRNEDLDESVTAYLDGGDKCLEAFSRTRSVEDLLNI